jgi:hypothetical protein
MNKFKLQDLSVVKSPVDLLTKNGNLSQRGSVKQYVKHAGKQFYDSIIYPNNTVKSYIGGYYMQVDIKEVANIAPKNATKAFLKLQKATKENQYMNDVLFLVCC